MKQEESQQNPISISASSPNIAWIKWVDQFFYSCCFKVKTSVIIANKKKKYKKRDLYSNSYRVGNYQELVKKDLMIANPILNR